MKLKTLLGAAVLSFAAAGAQAAVMEYTITFGDQPGSYTPYSENVFELGTKVSLDNAGGGGGENGKDCPTGDPACLKLNSGEYVSADLTRPVDQAFDLVSFWYEFSGDDGDKLLVSAEGQTTLEFSQGTDCDKNVGCKALVDWTGVTKVTFTYFGKADDVEETKKNNAGGGGVVRIDDIVVRYDDGGGVTVVPVPAGLPLLASGIGFAAVALRRKRKTA